MKFSSLVTFNPVSYTHLDVYKRQMHTFVNKRGLAVQTKDW